VHSDVHPIVERNYVARPHPNAPEAHRLADVAFFRGAVNVYATIVCGRILPFHSAQPDYARNYGVSTGRIDGDDFARGRAIFYHRAKGQMITKFAGNEQGAERCPITANIVAVTEL
jgi:hypothetical protein